MSTVVARYILILLIMFVAIPGTIIWLAVRSDRRATGAAKPGEFRDPTKLSRWTVWLLYAVMICTVFVLIFTVADFGLPGQAAGDDTTRPVTAMQLGGYLAIALRGMAFVRSGILILIWIHRANYNARALGASGMEFTPGWSVGWYFIPFANLWKPYQVMKEIWQASGGAVDWEKAPVSPMLGWWWGLWIVGNILDNISFRLSDFTGGGADPQAVGALDTLSALLFIPNCLILIRIIRTIQANQLSRSAVEAF